MATPKKKYPYNFIYEDSTYMTFELNRDDYDAIKKAMQSGYVVETDAGLINTSGLRFVVELKEAPAPKTDPVDADPDMSMEEKEYLRFLREGE